jgi:hypothetical protein
MCETEDVTDRRTLSQSRCGLPVRSRWTVARVLFFDILVPWVVFLGSVGLGGFFLVGGVVALLHADVRVGIGGIGLGSMIIGGGVVALRDPDAISTPFSSRWFR